MKNIKKVYYKDLLNIETKDNEEEFCFIKNYGIKGGYISGMADITKFFSGEIIVRENIIKMLLTANNKLKQIDRNLSLYVTYGYRSLEIQTNKFLEILRTIGTEKFMENPIDLYEKVHTCIAVPAVSGHPTGGAVDILIINDKTNETLDFGTEIYDYSINGGSSISYDNISKKAYNNRLLLNKVMTESGFAPYSEEYWHFSYGDKEWAFYYDKEYAIYAQKSLSEIKLSEA